MSQISLPFDWAGQAFPGRFIFSEANRLAARHIEDWRSWPLPISILTGPGKSGKSLLGAHFAEISKGSVIDDADMQEDQALFHAWNVARDTGRPLLLIAENAPGNWKVELPDLRSRLSAAPHVRIDQPDDALVRALIEMGLAQAGSAYAPDVPEWLSRRVERSYAVIARLLEALNSLSMSSSRKISVPLLKEALQNPAFLSILPHDERPAAPQQ